MNQAILSLIGTQKGNVGQSNEIQYETVTHGASAEKKKAWFRGFALFQVVVWEEGVFDSPQKNDSTFI